MADNGSILLRRGPTEDRLAFVPLKGEIIYDSDTQQVYIGDGLTYGGKTVFDDTIVVEKDGSLKIGENVAIIVDDDGNARALRVPGGSASTRPTATLGMLRYNSDDGILEFFDGDDWLFLNTTATSGQVVQLYVSKDGDDTGKFGSQAGRSQGTAFKTLNKALRLAEDLINAAQETEQFEYQGQAVKIEQIMVYVATGIYKEHLPLRVPPNVSIYGAGQRRTLIRPLPGEISTSPWARIRFWRETEAYPNGYFGYHYLSDPSDRYSTPLDNEDIDIFLCNNTNWFHEFSTEEHNSFAYVLDPEGQILTKSPYPHTGASFTKSNYANAPYEINFAGCMFADGFVGNQDFNVNSVDVADNSMIASGFWREPLMPTAFYADGSRYQANSVAPPAEAMPDAVSLLQQNKTFIQEETVAYVDDTYQFNYDETKCRRDLRYILEASSYDIVLGTNYNSVMTGLAYSRATTDYLKQTQKVETAAAINYAKGLANAVLASNSTLQAANVKAFDEVIDILNNGSTSADELVWPSVSNTNKNNARFLLESNKDYLIAEVIAFIDRQISEGNAPFAVDFTYDKTKCRRDTGYVIDALIHDILFDGNLATIRIAEAYWLDNDSYVYGQTAQTAAGYNYLKSMIGNVLLSTRFTGGYQSELTQDFDSSFPATLAEVNLAQGLLEVIVESIDEGLSYLPIIEYPDLSSIDTTVTTLRETFVKSFPTIIDDTIEWIDDTYNALDYVKSTCYRDVGLIIDALCFDMTYTGETKTVSAAETYTETGSSVIVNQEAETVDAINYMRTIVGNVLNQTTPTIVRQDVVEQVKDASLSTEAGSVTKAETLIDIITNYITNYTTIKAAHDVIETAKEDIQDDVIAYINSTYPALSYNTDLCHRDVGFIVSAVSNDLFGGSRHSILAGNSYYRAASDLGDPSVAITTQLTETLDGVAKAKELVRTALTSAGVSTSLINLADAKFDIILDIMENGENVAPESLPKFKVNASATTPLIAGLANRNLVMITAGNKSFVATDWTVFGNLGYGVLARNNARIELVSIFTYYCGVSYKAESGSEIRSLNGSSSNGIYGLGAEGRNPFEIPIDATTVSETCFIAQADSSVVGDNVAGDLSIVIKNAVDLNGSPATLFNVMVAEVDHQDPAYGIVRYEIGNLSGNNLNIRGTAQGLVADIHNNADITIRLLQEYEIETSSSINDLLLGAALVYDEDPDTGYRIIEKTPVSGSPLHYVVRTIPTLNHIGVVVNGAVTAGNNSFVINSINYTNDDVADRRIAYRGEIYTVQSYNTLTNTITISPNLTVNLADGDNLRLSPQPGSAGKIYTDFSVVKANNHDMLDVGTGAYQDSNYPRELYGPPTRPAVQSQEVFETAPGRVFFTTNDQDGNYRVGDYFRVNQGDGSVTFSAAIALSNLDGLGFTRGVVVNEFSSDSDMIDESDEALPTEQAVVNYINKRIGQNQLGATVGTTRIGAGLLVLDGSQAMEGDLDLDSNNLDNVGTITAGTVDANTAATLASAKVEDLTSGRVVIAGTGGEIEDDSDLTYNKTTNILSVPKLDIGTQADLASAKVEDLTVNRVVVVGTGGELIDDANFTWNGSTLSLTGDLDVNAQGSFTSANIEDLTNNRIVIAGTNGELEDDANLTFDGTTFEIGTKFDVTVTSGNTYIGGTLGIDGNVTLNKSSNFVIKDSATTPNTVFQVSGATGNTTVAGELKLSDLLVGRIPYVGNSNIIKTDTSLSYDGTTFTVGSSKVSITASSGNTAIAGTLGVTGSTTLSSVNVTDLTSGRVILAGSDGELQDSGNLTFDGTNLTTSKLTVDNTVIDNDKITIIGGEIYANGTATTGDIYIIPAYDETASPIAYSTVYITGNLSVVGSINTTEQSLTDQAITGNLTVDGNSTLGDSNSDTVTINAKVNSSIIPNATSLTLGDSNNVWEALYVNDITAADDVTITTSGDFVIKNSATPTPATVFSVTGANGNTTIAGTLSATGNFAINTNKFTVTATSGDTSIAGTLGVTGNTTITGTLAANSGITVDTNKFVVADTTGNVSTAGTLSATGNFAINTNKFTVTATSGNTSIAGTLGVTGATTITGALAANSGITVDTNKFVVADTTGNVSTAGTLSATGNFAINTNKFTVTATSGDTSIAGTLSVNGDMQLNAAADFIIKDNTSPTPITKFSVDGATGNTEVAGSITGSGDVLLKSSSNITIVTGTTVSAENVTFDVDGATGDTYIKGDLVVDGDITISGDVLSELVIEDNVVLLNSNYVLDPENGGAEVNAGIEVERGIQNNVQLRWNEGTNTWQFSKVDPSTGAVTYEDIASTIDVSNAAENDYVTGAAFNTSDGVLTLTLLSSNTVTADLDGRFVLDTGDTMTGNLNFSDTAEGITWSMNTDGASIKFYNTGDADTDSRLEFNTADNNNEYFRWTHSPSGGALYESMRLTPTSSGNGVLKVSGDVQATGEIYTNTISSYTANADLNLSGNGTGNVNITDSLDVNTITSYTANADLNLSGNGTGKVLLNDSVTIGSANTDTVTFTADIASNLIPDTTTRNIGSNTDRWNTMYATVFNGTATQAKYADLAEIYSTDKEYEPGTLVQFGGEAEVTITNERATTRVAGVISTLPAYLMNSEASGQAIALKGRVPCKVFGKVKKGDFIIASNIPGVGMASDKYIGGAVVGKSIVNSDEEQVRIIEIAVGVL